MVAGGALCAGHDACSEARFVADHGLPATPGSPHAVAYHPTQADMATMVGALDVALDR